MSPDARLIAVALIGQDCGPEEAVRRLGILETALPPAEPQPGIRGMVPVAYLKALLDELGLLLSLHDAPEAITKTLGRIDSARAALKQFQEDA